MAIATNASMVPPSVMSVQRITMLIASLVVALGSGTNYVFSAYSPQLGARLGITHTQLNLVGLAGNVGVYSSGPVWGRIVDTRGPLILQVCSFVLLLGGYSGIRYFYDSGLPADGVTTTLPTLAFCALVAFSFMTGAGGNAGLTSAVNSTAKTFPDRARASTTGLVISGFGLSAFFFSGISHIFFAGNTSDFLLVLALGTATPMIIGFFLVRSIPLPPHELEEQGGYNALEHGEENPEAAATSALPQNIHNASSSAHLLDNDFGPTTTHIVHHAAEIEDDDETYVDPVEEEVELDPQEIYLEENDRGGCNARVRSMSRGRAMSLGALPNLYGTKLFRSGDFWLLFFILSILSGTGLMYINNVGSMSQALYVHQTAKYDEIEASGWQATQVSTISLTNFSGRIFIGLISDFAKNKFAMPRSYCLVLVSTLFFISQVVASREDKIENLWIASALLGLAHGSVFSLFPTVCLEWFGMPHFSENWGYLSLSPIAAGNMFSVVFGINLDAHDGRTKSPISQASIRRTTAVPQCLQGLECYVATIYLTIGATFLSILLSFWAGFRDTRKIAISRQMKLSRHNEVVWDQEEGY